MSTDRHTLSKAERLKSYKKIRLLFEKGQKLKLYPIVVYYHIKQSSSASLDNRTVQMGVSVGTRYFKKAVDRNLIKRRIREAYRKNNAALKRELMKNESSLDVFFVYTTTELFAYDQLESTMVKVLQVLQEKIVGNQNLNPENSL